MIIGCLACNRPTRGIGLISDVQSSLRAGDRMNVAEIRFFGLPAGQCVSLVRFTRTMVPMTEALAYCVLLVTRALD